MHLLLITIAFAFTSVGAILFEDETLLVEPGQPTNDSIISTRTWGLRFPLPGIYKPPTTGATAACDISCCKTQCTVGTATACTAGATPGVLGTCTPAAPAPTFCRSTVATCATCTPHTMCPAATTLCMGTANVATC